jgi:lysophospholipase L1-like esterase/peptidoglycan/xylan/chitin deacetylase (PgdA/CDA1 family)
MRPLATFAALLAATALTGAVPARDRTAHWVGSWGSAQLVADGDNALPTSQGKAVTLRQVVRLSAGGERLRVRFSNLFGTTPLTIGAASVAPALAPGTARIGSSRPLRFAGQAQAVIPPGAEIWSDPVAVPLPPGADLAISLYWPDVPNVQTGHPGARGANFLVAGDHVADPELADATTMTRWYGIADVEVAGPATQGTLVAIGDSITDGYGVTGNRNTRWSDILAGRLRADAATRGIGMVNAGIGGGRVLLDGNGPNLMARFDRDVIARTDVRWAILLEGVNDLGVLTREAPATSAAHRAIVQHITAAYAQLADRAHAHGITLIGGTITPFGGNGYYHPGPETEADRQAINAFIRTSGTFDAVVDFDRLLRDPAHPDRLRPTYDSGDHLHPSEAGYKAMGDAVPLTLFSARQRPVAVAAALAPVPVAPAPAPAPTIAITFDDIPAHGPLPPGMTRLEVIRRITAALRAAGAPAHGFLNAGFGLDDPTSAAVIRAWRAAGFPLGNHSYAHENLDQVGADAFLASVKRNEGPLAMAAGRSDWHWFRYPFLAEGRDPAARDAVRARLAADGYRIAGVTMSFDDFAWNPVYAACAAKGDKAAIARLETGMLADARAAALAARSRAKAQVGHDIPYVLLMHVGALDARLLPRILAQYRAMGFRFTTLAQAEADPFYAAALDPRRPGPTATLNGPAVLKGPPAGLCQ